VYGLRLTGFDGGRMVAGCTHRDFPVVKVHQQVGPVLSDRLAHIGPERASFPIDSGRLEMSRSECTAIMRSAAPLPPDEVVHPWLSRVGGTFGRWLGREVLHGGAVVVDGRAWALLGGAGAGKSTLLAILARKRHDVLTDDVLVMHNGLVFAGPRCVDLRPDAAATVGMKDALPVRGGTRRRVELPRSAAAVPLGGIVHLDWGAHAEARPVPLDQRIARLRAQAWLGVHDPIGKSALLELVAVPTLELLRPRRENALATGAAVLLDAVRGYTGRP
jgi:hypothetical protein